MAEQNNFWINLVAVLQKSKSKKQVQSDAKNLGDIYIPLIGRLNKTKTKAQIKQDLSTINGTVNLNTKINSKGVQTATRQAINNAQRVANSNKVHLNFDTSKQQLINQIKILGRNNNKLFNNREMTTKFNQLLNSANVAKSTSELKTLRGELSAFKTELVATNNAGMTWGSKFKESIKSYAKFFSGASMIYAISNQVRNAVTEAKTLDDSLVNLQKVTDEIADRDALYKYFDKSLQKAQELNVKVGSLIDAVTEFKKLGWSLEDAELGAKWANILSNVGDTNIETAIGSIKTSIASFDEIGGYGNDQMDKKLEAYTDLINNMSNKYSIDAEGLAESIRLSAGTLTEAHTSIEQAATMFATANKYYNDPSYLGNTAKIGSLRMRASTGDKTALQDLQEMGEEVDDLATATSKLREKLMALTGVDIMVDDHTFKSYYDQLYEISQVMDKLDDTSRANVLETMFGKSRSAAGAALLSGMKESASAYEDAINSAGSATEEYQTWMTSADAACQRFSNTLTETYQSIINGNTVRDLANLGSAVLEFANNWGIVEGTLKGVIALNLGKFIATGGMALITATKQVEQYGQALQMASNVPNGSLSAKFQALKSIAQATSSLTTEQLSNVLATKTLTQADRVRILQMQGMTKEMALQKLAEMNLTQATNAQTVANNASTASTFSLKAAMTGLGATLKSVFLSNPVGIALMGISLGVSAVTSAVSKHNQAVEEARQKAKEALESVNKEIDDTTSKIKKLESMDNLSITDKEDLEQLRLQNKELRIRQKYLEAQKQKDKEKVSKYAEQSYKNKYGASIDRSDIDKYKENYNTPKGQTASTYLTGGSNTTSTPYGAGQQAQEQEEGNRLAELIAQYEYYSDLKKKAIQDEDSEAIDKYNKKLKSISGKLSEDRTELQGFKDDIEASGEASPYLDEIAGKLKLIDDTLLSPGQNLVNFINSKELEGDKKNLVELANSGKLTQDELEKNFSNVNNYLKENGLTLEDLISVIKIYKEELENVPDKIPVSFTDTISQIQSLSNGLDQLDKVYADVYNKGDFDWSSILNNDDFKAAFEGLGDAYNDFIKTISNSPSDLNACQSAFDKLTTAYIYNSDALKNVTEETKQATINMLEQMGVANASEMVEARLAAQKVYTAQTGKNLSDATYAEIASLVAESDAANTTTQYLANLALSKLDINNLKLSTNDDVNAIIAIANAAGASAAQLKALKSALNAIGAAQSKFKSDSEKVVTSDKSLTNAYANSKFGGSTLLQKAKNQAQTNKNNQAAVVKDTATSALSDVKKLLTQIQNGAYNLNASNFYAKYGGGSATQSAVDKAAKGSGSGSKSPSGSSKEETPKDYNLIEIAIDRVKRAVTNLGKTVSATYKNWSTRNNALAQEMSAVSSEIGIQQQAYNKYMQLANSVGLPENYASLIRNGAIDEITVTDKDLQDKIDKYKEYYEAALDASDAIQDLQDNLAELAKTKFDNINKEYESRISLIKHEADMLNSFIDEAETRGHITSTKYYEELMKVERNNIKELNAEYSNLSYALEEALNSGRIQRYSEDWYDMVQTINDTAEAIEDANKSLAEYESTMRKLNWDVFDKQEDYISKIQDESDFIIGLLGKNDLFDKDTGKMTEYGQATAGLHAVNYNAYMTQADDYAKEIQKINEDLAKDPYNTTLIERKQELLELQQKAISSAEDEKQSIKDLISDGYDAMLDALQKMIDKRKELLQAEKDAYDYQNTISEKTKNVADIQKQLIAIRGDDSEEGKANAQKLGVSLDEAQKDLQETEYEKYLSDQQQMLDNLYD